MKDTISSFLSMQNALNTRRSQLNEVKNASTQRTFNYFGNEQKTSTEPTYDIKKVDKKITLINKALFEIDKRIKESNAKTEIEVNLDFDDLMNEVE